MDRKMLNEVDGYAVDEYQGTFTGTFEVEGADVRHLAYDEEVLVVVRARVKVPRLKERANGDLVRVNVLGVKEVGIVRSDSLKKHLTDTLGMEQPQAQLEFPTGAAEEEVLDEEPEVEAHEVPDTASFAAQGLRVVPFNPDEADIGPGPMEREVVGAVKATKDSKLSAFLTGDTP
jgi:hypothetical protein